MKTFISPFNTAVLNLGLKNGIWVGVATVTAVSTSLTVYSHSEEITKGVNTIKDFIEEQIIKVKPFFDKYVVPFTSTLINGYVETGSNTKLLSEYTRTKGEVWGKRLWEITKNGELWRSLLAHGKNFHNEIFDSIFEVTSLLSYAKEISDISGQFLNLETIKSVLVGVGRMLLNLKELISKFRTFFTSSEFGTAGGRIGNENKDFGSIASVVFSLLKVSLTHSSILTSLTQKDLEKIVRLSFKDVNGLRSRANALFGKPIKRANGENVEAGKRNVLRALLPFCEDGFWECMKETIKFQAGKGVQKSSVCEEGKVCDSHNLVEDLKEDFSSKIENLGFPKETAKNFTNAIVNGGSKFFW